jgi:hypothetical protein
VYVPALLLLALRLARAGRPVKCSTHMCTGWGGQPCSSASSHAARKAASNAKGAQPFPPSGQVAQAWSRRSRRRYNTAPTSSRGQRAGGNDPRTGWNVRQERRVTYRIVAGAARDDRRFPSQRLEVADELEHPLEAGGAERREENTQAPRRAAAAPSQAQPNGAIERPWPDDRRLP